MAVADRYGSVWIGQYRLGRSWPSRLGAASPGKAWPGQKRTRCGGAWQSGPGAARHGTARPGTARSGMARQGIFFLCINLPAATLQGMRWTGVLLIGLLAVPGQVPQRQWVSKEHRVTWDPPLLDVEGNPEVLAAGEIAVSLQSTDLRVIGSPLARAPAVDPTGITPTPILTLLNQLVPGDYRLWARVQDAAGNWSQWSDPLQVSYDPLPPSAPKGVQCRKQ